MQRAGLAGKRSAGACDGRQCARQPSPARRGHREGKRAARRPPHPSAPRMLAIRPRKERRRCTGLGCFPHPRAAARPGARGANPHGWMAGGGGGSAQRRGSPCRRRAALAPRPGRTHTTGRARAAPGCGFNPKHRTAMGTRGGARRPPRRALPARRPAPPAGISTPQPSPPAAQAPRAPRGAILPRARAPACRRRAPRARAPSRAPPPAREPPRRGAPRARRTLYFCLSSLESGVDMRRRRSDEGASKCALRCFLRDEVTFAENFMAAGGGGVRARTVARGREERPRAAAAPKTKKKKRSATHFRFRRTK